eukprot:6524073-Lingulodinium_polyedra.AAC.1
MCGMGTRCPTWLGIVTWAGFSLSLTVRCHVLVLGFMGRARRSLRRARLGQLVERQTGHISAFYCHLCAGLLRLAAILGMAQFASALQSFTGWQLLGHL